MLSRGVRKKLQSIVGKEYLHLEPAELALYGYDAAPTAEDCLPDAVVFPADAEQVAAIVRLANKERLPVVTRGAGTNLTGGTRCVHGGLVLSIQRMNHIVQIDMDNLQAIVEPGVTTEQLQDAAEEVDLFYPPDPQSMESCTLGGNLAENAGGPRAVKYGVTRQYVLALQVVLPNGELVEFGARTIKSVAGYDMVSLLVGSEGTLGIITRATLRLIPQPKTRGTCLAAFDDMKAAAAAVSATLRSGVVPAAIEFIDHNAIRSVEEFQPVGLPREAQAVLVVEVDGEPDAVTEQLGRVEQVMRTGGAVRFEQAADGPASRRLWQARRAVGPSLARIAPIKVNEDIVVPISRLPEAVAGVHRIAQSHDITCACFGHAGDGNIHVNFLLQPEDPEMSKRVDLAVRETFELVVSLEGSITGEHGVGTTKQAFLPLEVSTSARQAMRAVKKALDPNNIMNPGKILPEEDNLS